MVLKKGNILFARDSTGQFVPELVALVVQEEDEEQLKYKDEKISIVPMSRGDIKKLFADTAKKDDKDLDCELIVKYCKDPVFTAEDVDSMKSSFTTMIVNTIMEFSGLKVDKGKAASIKEKEDEFSKNSEGLNQTKKKAI